MPNNLLQMPSPLQAERTISFTKSVSERFEEMARQSEQHFLTVLAAIAEWKAQDQRFFRELSDLRERIAVIESKLASKAS
jgi:hypothetical protein